MGCAAGEGGGGLPGRPHAGAAECSALRDGGAEAARRVRRADMSERGAAVDWFAVRAG